MVVIRVWGCSSIVRLKALVVVGDGLEDYGDLLAVGRAETKRMLRTHKNVNVKNILHSAKCGVHVITLEVPQSAMVKDKPLVVSGG